MRLLLDSGWAKVLAVVAVIAAVIYGGVWISKIDERRTYGLLETALDYGGVDDRAFRSYRTEGPAAPCTDRASVGFMNAGIEDLDGLERAATIADRYELEGWTVTRFISSIDDDTGLEDTRWFIVKTDEISLLGSFDPGAAEVSVRTGPCLVGHGISDSLALEVGTFERDPAGQDLVYGLLETALGYGGIEGPETRWAMSFPKDPDCEGGAYQGNVLADVASGDGLERVAVVADRYEQEGWMVSRYVDVNGRDVRWFIATQDEASLRGQFTQGEAIFDVRAGQCIATHQVRDVDVAIEQFPPR